MVGCDCGRNCRWGGELCVITREEHLDATVQCYLGNHVKQRTLGQEDLIPAKRSWQAPSLLDAVLQPRECHAGIELAGADVSPGTASHERPPLVILGQKLQALAEEERHSNSWGSQDRETPLFTRELQRQLLDIRFSLAEDLDVWQDLWAGTEVLLEDFGGAVLVFGGYLPLCPAENMSLASCCLQQVRNPVKAF